MTITYDHRFIPTCGCVHTRLRVAVAMLDRARELTVSALSEETEPHLALEQVAQSAKYRAAAACEVREALRVIEEPPPHPVSTEWLSGAEPPGSTPTEAA
jgi:hypothetical protein